MTLLTLDANCVIPFVKHELGTRSEELDALIALIHATEDGSIELQLTVSYDRDAARSRNDDGRVRQLEWLSSAPILPRRAAGLFVIGVSVLDGPDVIASNDDADLYDAIRTVLAPHVDFTLLDTASSDELAKITSDIDHLIASHKSGAAAFVTLDHRTILVYRHALSELHITVLLPTEAASAYVT